MKINTKLIIYFTILFICCILFNFHIWLTYENIDLMISATIFCILILALSIVLIYILRGHMIYILNQLSELISSIINMNEVEIFSVLNDDMLSKLQSQVIKLTSILKGQNVRIKRERDEIKSLISDISHQLKTPLSNLKIYYGLLQDTPPSHDDYIDFNDSMRSQIEKLSFLLDSMIKMSRLEGGIIKLIKIETSLNDICLTAIKQVYQKAISKSIEIKFTPSRDIILNIDKNWTVEAIFNIIDNAVKYNNIGGTIMIEIMQYEMFARINIVDNGIGIHEKEINNIFKRFYRGEHTNHEDGVGLGLYLAREIIAKQNGYIKVSSNASQGSIFSLFLPYFNCI